MDAKPLVNASGSYHIPINDKMYTLEEVIAIAERAGDVETLTKLVFGQDEEDTDMNIVSRWLLTGREKE